MNWKAIEEVSHGEKNKYQKRPTESPSYSLLIVCQPTGIHCGHVCAPTSLETEGTLGHSGSNAPGRGENPLRESQLPVVTREVWSSQDSPPTLGGTAQSTSQMVSMPSCCVGDKHNSSESMVSDAWDFPSPLTPFYFQRLWV